MHRARDFRVCRRSGLDIYGVDERRGGAEKKVYTGPCEGSDEFGCVNAFLSKKRFC